MANLILPNAPVPQSISPLSQIAGTQTVERVVFTEDLEKKFNASQLWFAFEGKVTYDDVFGKKHWITFCYSSYHRRGPVVTRPPKGAEKCVQYNNMDDE